MAKADESVQAAKENETLSIALKGVKENPIGHIKSVFDRSIDVTSEALVGWAAIGLHDSQVRQWCIQKVQEESRRIKVAVQQGKISPLRGAVDAHKLRGDVMKKARRFSTGVGKAVAEFLKKDNLKLKTGRKNAIKNWTMAPWSV